jgi:hypothetical protein
LTQTIFHRKGILGLPSSLELAVALLGDDDDDGDDGVDGDGDDDDDGSGG